MGYLSHPYAWRLASASFAGATIERLQYRETLDIVIRFADWRGRRFQPKALEIGENELLVLIGDGLAQRVFSDIFVGELRTILQECPRASMATIRNITAANKPSAFSNHVIVEQVDGCFHVGGASNVNQYVTHLSKQVRNRDDALREAMAWAIEHAIPEIFVVEPANADRT